MSIEDEIRRERMEEKAEGMGVDADVLMCFEDDATRFDESPAHSRLAVSHALTYGGL